MADWWKRGNALAEARFNPIATTPPFIHINQQYLKHQQDKRIVVIYSTVNLLTFLQNNICTVPRKVPNRLFSSSFHLTHSDRIFL